MGGIAGSQGRRYQSGPIGTPTRAARATRRASNKTFQSVGTTSVVAGSSSPRRSQCTGASAIENSPPPAHPVRTLPGLGLSAGQGFGVVMAEEREHAGLVGDAAQEPREGLQFARALVDASGYRPQRVEDKHAIADISNAANQPALPGRIIQPHPGVDGEPERFGNGGLSAAAQQRLQATADNVPSVFVRHVEHPHGRGHG